MNSVFINWVFTTSKNVTSMTSSDLNLFSELSQLSELGHFGDGTNNSLLAQS